uniref:Uncharacterized protein n=1 Tax=Ditylenchus dipsaci TaxID=166011 RepID=A0A915D1F2_9BILA
MLSFLNLPLKTFPSDLQTKEAGDATINLLHSIELVDGQAVTAAVQSSIPTDLALKGTKAAGEESASVLAEVAHLPQDLSTQRKSAAKVSDQSTRQFSIQQQQVLANLSKLGDVGTAEEHVIHDSSLQKSSSTQREFGNQQVETAVDLQKLHSSTKARLRLNEAF